LMLLLVLTPRILSAQTKLKVAYPTTVGSMAVIWVTKDAKLFEKYGLDVELIYVAGSSRIVQSMLAKDIPISEIAIPAVIQANLAGADLVMLAGPNNKPGQKIMVKPEIKRPEDMANKKIGVSRLGTVTHFALQTALDGYGVKNVTILQMGGQPEAFAGLARGSVDGAVFSPPYNFQLKKQGYNELVSPNDLKKFTDFITNGIVARRSVIEKDKDTVIRVIKVTAEAIKLIQTDKDYTKKVIMKWMPMKDPDLLEQAYLFASENYAKEGLVNEGALRSMVKQMVQSNLIDPKLAGSTPITAYYDNRYVEEVKRSGFFDQLWK